MYLGNLQIGTTAQTMSPLRSTKMAYSPAPRVPGKVRFQSTPSRAEPGTLLNGLPEKMWLAFGYHDRLARLLTILTQKPDQPMSLTHAAKIACMETTAFSKFFRRTTGMRFNNCIQRLRINQAAHLLQTRDLSVTEISQCVGYGSLVAFERHFKKELGITAREYRARFATSKSSPPAAA